VPSETSAVSGLVIPPFMVYARKWPVPKKLREGAVFHVSDNGWMTKDLFSEWLLKMIPPPSSGPVLLVLDGHGSHITIDVIEHARANQIHMLCLPSHTSIFCSLWMWVSLSLLRLFSPRFAVSTWLRTQGAV